MINLYSIGQLLLAAESRPAYISLGQNLYNPLWAKYPGLANEINGGPLDPFHDDDNIPDFIKFLCEKALE